MNQLYRNTFGFSTTIWSVYWWYYYRMDNLDNLVNVEYYNYIHFNTLRSLVDILSPARRGISL